jgi:hypothetical protein
VTPRTERDRPDFLREGHVEVWTTGAVDQLLHDASLEASYIVDRAQYLGNERVVQGLREVYVSLVGSDEQVDLEPPSLAQQLALLSDEEQRAVVDEADTLRRQLRELIGDDDATPQ